MVRPENLTVPACLPLCGSESSMVLVHPAQLLCSPSPQAFVCGSAPGLIPETVCVLHTQGFVSTAP